MDRPSIIILDAGDARVGVDLQQILEREDCYHVNRVGGLNGERDVAAQPLSLIIPILPPGWKRADELLAKVRARHEQIPLLPVISPHALSERDRARLTYAQDFLLTPLRAPEVCFRVRRLVIENQIPRSWALETAALAQLIGEEPEFVNLKGRIPSIARLESTVLLTGETGTGKERFARALHYSSRRAGKPFLAINCGAIPEDLLESELFGHRKGAFTGAFATHPGLIAEAENGTLFLDEIEALPMRSQVKLLRFLQDKTYYALGCAKLKQANVWIIASTNVELPSKVEEGAFRQDLYYRLSVINVYLPPLRERKGDISVLAAHFWKLYAPKADRGELCLPDEVRQALIEYAWPGNVRELENLIQRLVVLAETESIRPENLGLPLTSHASDKLRSPFAQMKARIIAEFERDYLTKLLRLHGGNITRAAIEAGKDRRALGRLVKKYQISRT